jgi:hypothetical protein
VALYKAIKHTLKEDLALYVRKIKYSRMYIIDLWGVDVHRKINIFQVLVHSNCILVRDFPQPRESQPMIAP